jgi:hypothetical protein
MDQDSFKMASRWSKMASKLPNNVPREPQDGASGAKLGQDCSKCASTQFQNRPRCFKEVSRWSQHGPRWSKMFVSGCLWFSSWAFSGAPWLCLRFAFALPSLCFRFAFVLPSLCLHFAFAVPSNCLCFAFAFVFLCFAFAFRMVGSQKLLGP